MPVWDEFLTDRDRAVLEASGRGARPHVEFGRRPALLVIDDYYGALGTEPEDILASVKKWPSSCGLEGWEAIHKTVDLIAAARAANVLVIYSTGTGDAVPSPWGIRSPGPRPALTPEQKELQYKIVDEIAPAAGDLVVRKASPSAFYGTPLMAHLIANQIDTIIACGETTSGCVRASVIDGCTNRFKMGVVEDCTFDRTQASHALNLFDMDQKYGHVISLADAIAYFDSIGETR